MLPAIPLAHPSFITVLFILLTVAPTKRPDLLAQATRLNDTTTIIVAAVEYAYSLVDTPTPDRASGLDRRALVNLPDGHPGRRVGEHEESLLVAVSRSLRTRITDLRTAIQCGNGPRDCRLVGVSALIGVGVPQIDGDVALVPVEFAYTVPALPGEVVRSGWVIVVKRDRDQWRAVATERRWAT